MPMILTETAVTIACIYAGRWWVMRLRRQARRTTEPPSTEDGATILCSFCGKSRDAVRKLIAGPSVYICDERIDLCNDIIAEERDREDVRPKPRPSPVLPWPAAGVLALLLLVAFLYFNAR